MEAALTCLLCARIDSGFKPLSLCEFCGLGPLCSECMWTDYHQAWAHGSLLTCARVCQPLPTDSWRCMVCCAFLNASSVEGPMKYLKCRFCSMTPLCDECRLPLMLPGCDLPDVYHGGRYAASRRRPCKALRPFVFPKKLLFLQTLSFCSTCSNLFMLNSLNPARECDQCVERSRSVKCLVCLKDLSGAGIIYSCDKCQRGPMCFEHRVSRRSNFLTPRIRLFQDGKLTRLNEREKIPPAYTHCHITPSFARAVFCLGINEEVVESL